MLFFGVRNKPETLVASVYSGLEIPGVNYFTDYGAMAIALLFGWINLTYLLRQFPRWGIYVMMIGHVLSTFLDFFAVFAIYVVAFGTTFSMLLGNKAPFFTNIQSYSAFKNFGRKFHSKNLKNDEMSKSKPKLSNALYITTSVMMTGELDLELIHGHYNLNSGDSESDVYEGKLNNHLAAKFVFVLFMVLMAVVINNLLVGLAVDDIDSIRETAEANRIALMIDDTLRYEFQGVSQMRKFWMKIWTCCSWRTKKCESLSFDKMEEDKMTKKYDGQGMIKKYRWLGN